MESLERYKVVSKSGKIPRNGIPDKPFDAYIDIFNRLFLKNPDELERLNLSDAEKIVITHNAFEDAYASTEARDKYFNLAYAASHASVDTVSKLSFVEESRIYNVISLIRRLVMDTLTRNGLVNENFDYGGVNYAIVL